MSAAASVTPRRKPAHTAVTQKTEHRRFEGKRFVALEENFLDAICEGCDSPTELKLVLQIMNLANRREPGNPFGWSEPIMLGELAQRVGCTRQYINCAAKTLFSETGILERMEKGTAAKAGVIDSGGDSRSFAYRVRAEYWHDWLKLRRAARKRAEAQREKLQKKVEKPPAIRPYSLPSPVRLGPGAKPFELPDDAREAIANCTAITAQRPGELRHLSVDAKGVIVLDFETAPAAVPNLAIDNPSCRSAASSPPDPDPAIDKPSCRSSNVDTENKRLSRSVLDPADPAATAALFGRFRDDLDQLLMERLHGPIDDAIFGQLLKALEPLSPARCRLFLSHVANSREGRKTTSWPFLLHLAPKVLTREARAQQLAAAPVDEQEPAGDPDNDWQEPPPEDPARAETLARLSETNEKLRAAEKDLKDAGTSSIHIDRARGRIAKLEAERDRLRRDAGL